MNIDEALIETKSHKSHQPIKTGQDPKIGLPNYTQPFEVLPILSLT